MKKVIMPAILFMGFIAFANAQVATESQAPTTEQAQCDSFKAIAITDLSETLQGAIKALSGEAYDVKDVEFNAAKEQTKVVLVNKENKEEKSITLDKDGNEVNS